MKSNELMIGDWVMQDDNLQQNRVCQITGIYNNVVVDVTGEKLPLHESHIKPIPLTPEILEKNGFEFLIDTWYLQTEERKPIHIRFMDGFIANSINCNIIPMGLKYVHQLQHALRLCGITREIIL